METRPIYTLIKKRRYQEAAVAIARHLGLPIEITLSNSSDTYDPRRAAEFRSEHLVNIDSKGHAQGGVTAEVNIPQVMPMFGTQALVGYQISVRVSEGCYKHPNTLISLLAHEFSHVLLAACYHPEKNNEIFTDLTSMVLGFKKVTSIGRKTVKIERNGNTSTRHTTTYGYMTDAQFSFAMSNIRSQHKAASLQHSQIMGRISTLHKILTKAQRQLDETETILSILDRRPPKRMKGAIVQIIVKAHQPGFFDELRKPLVLMGTNLDSLKTGLVGIGAVKPLSQVVIDNEAKQNEECRSAAKEVEEVYRAFRRYAPWKLRIKLLLRH